MDSATMRDPGLGVMIGQAIVATVLVIGGSLGVIVILGTIAYAILVKVDEIRERRSRLK